MNSDGIGNVDWRGEEQPPILRQPRAKSGQGITSPEPAAPTRPEWTSNAPSNNYNRQSSKPISDSSIASPFTNSRSLNISDSRLSADAKEFIPCFAPTETVQQSADPSLARSSYSGKYNASDNSSNCAQTPLYAQKKKSAQARLAKYQIASDIDSSHQETGGTERNIETYGHHNVHVNHDVLRGNDNYIDSAAGVVKQFQEFMQEVTVKPGKFTALGKTLVEESATWFGDSDIVKAVVDAIVSQTIVEQNFHYNGARLCSILSAECDATGYPVFSQLLLERMQKEYDEIFPVVESYPSRAYGFVGFLGDLYTQIGSPELLPILADFMLNILDAFVSAPSKESIKQACRSLKCAGKMLDRENKEKMDTIITKLAFAGYTTKTTDVVGTVVLLRASKWGEETEGNNTRSNSSFFSPPGQQYLESEATQYGPDGLALSTEESDFLHRESFRANDDRVEYEDVDDYGDEHEFSAYEDEMDEEIQKGFEQFLRDTKQV